MTNEFIPYEQALALKGLGFHVPCFGNYYTLDGKIWKLVDNGQYDLLDELYDIGSKFTISAPTYSQAFRWFREKYGFFHYVTTHDSTDFEWYIYDKYQNDWEDDIVQNT